MDILTNDDGGTRCYRDGGRRTFLVTIQKWILVRSGEITPSMAYVTILEISFTMESITPIECRNKL
jgi:hypothetical protein